MSQVLITTVPFAQLNTYPKDILEKNNISFTINPLGRKLTESELCHLARDCEVIIAGTEPITEKVFNSAKNLKLISRVGIGLDSVDLLAARKRNINVSYTPDAPAPAVAELTIGLMLSLIRHTHKSNLQLHNGIWNRFFGKRIVDCKIGLIGLGRIGQKVLNHLQSLGVKNILYNDILEIENNDAHYSTKEEIYKSSDIISLHLPLTSRTKDLITKKEIGFMNKDAFLINTSRGGIINEKDLSEALSREKISGAAIDVFDNEPYDGDLKNFESCILTSHMGSMSNDCRSQMEIEATNEAVRFLLEGRQEGAVPEEEYLVQKQGL